MQQPPIHLIPFSPSQTLTVPTTVFPMSEACFPLDSMRKKGALVIFGWLKDAPRSMGIGGRFRRMILSAFYLKLRKGAGGARYEWSGEAFFLKWGRGSEGLGWMAGCGVEKRYIYVLIYSLMFIDREFNATYRCSSVLRVLAEVNLRIYGIGYRPILRRKANPIS